MFDLFKYNLKLCSKFSKKPCSYQIDLLSYQTTLIGMRIGKPTMQKWQVTIYAAQRFRRYLDERKITQSD